MLVGNRMISDPITVTADDLLIHARLKMQKGNFRRLPVLSDGKLVGIITDRNLREHVGLLARTGVKAAMSKKPITVTPAMTVEATAQLMLKHKIGGLPVVQNDRLVGIITTSDIIQAFLDVMGAYEETSIRIDFVSPDATHSLADASKIIAHEGGEVLSLGTHREKWRDTPVYYLRLRSGDADAITQGLRRNGFDVLGVHPVGS